MQGLTEGLCNPILRHPNSTTSTARRTLLPLRACNLARISPCLARRATAFSRLPFNPSRSSATRICLTVTANDQVAEHSPACALPLDVRCARPYCGPACPHDPGEGRCTTTSAPQKFLGKPNQGKPTPAGIHPTRHHTGCVAHDHGSVHTHL